MATKGKKQPAASKRSAPPRSKPAAKRAARTPKPVRPAQAPAPQTTPELPVPLTFRTILVPIDFSEHSKQALRYAVRFAKVYKAAVDLLYVVEPAIYPADFSFGQVGYPNIEEELKVRGDNELQNLARAEVPSDVTIRTSVRTGKAFFEITEYAREENIDLIIIGTHGHTGMEHILFGSTAEKVVRKAHCTVLVFRSGEQP